MFADHGPDLSSKAARDPLRELARATGETANVAVLHDGAVLWVLSESGNRLRAAAQRIEAVR